MNRPPLCGYTTCNYPGVDLQTDILVPFGDITKRVCVCVGGVSMNICVDLCMDTDCLLFLTEKME